MKYFFKPFLTPLAIAGIASLSLPAHAEVSIASAQQIDEIMLLGAGVDFGGDGFTQGTPDNPGQIQWKQNWFGPIPSVKGKIHFRMFGTSCARIQVVSYDTLGDVLSKEYSDEVCSEDNSHQQYDVQQNGSYGVNGHYGAREILVRLQTKDGNGNWNGISSQSSIYGPVLGVSDVLSSNPELDLGTGNFVNGAPENPATVTWKVEENGLVVPFLEGTLYAHRADDLCFRMRYVYKNTHNGGDTVLADNPGITHCETDDRLHTYAVNTGNFKHLSTTEIEIILEKRSSGGSWSNPNDVETVGTVTSTLPEIPINRSFLDTSF